jgi:SAM-dependent methyltransferase
MEVAQGNEPQAEFWRNAGPVWAALQDQLDAQVAPHGLAALEAAAAQAGERALDIGCGTGTTTVQLATSVAPGGSVEGLDISPSMVAAAQQRAESAGVGNASFTVADAQAHPFEAGAYDLVFSRFGVMFFSDPVAAFTNMRSALRPGGRLVFSCWQGPAENEWVSRPLEATRRHIDLPLGNDPTAPGPLSLSDPERVRGILADAGYSEVELQDVRLPVRLGETVEAAVDFMYALNPATAGLDDRDAQLARDIRQSLGEVFADYLGPDGVETPSATWLVKAVAP